MVARLTPDHKVACSNHVEVTAAKWTEFEVGKSYRSYIIKSLKGRQCWSSPSLTTEILMISGDWCMISPSGLTKISQEKHQASFLLSPRCQNFTPKGITFWPWERKKSKSVEEVRFRIRLWLSPGSTRFFPFNFDQVEDAWYPCLFPVFWSTTARRCRSSEVDCNPPSGRIMVF